MIRIIALLFPVFASLFWTLLLSGERSNSNIPRSFLAKFMFLSFLFYTCKFVFYVPFRDIYVYFDVFYLYIGSLLYPIYHIYFRLLTVDEKFSWKAHSRYLILPVVLVSIYEVFVLFTPANEFKASLFDPHAFPDSPHIRLLNGMRTVLRIYFEIQLIVAVIQNYKLVRRYNVKAGQFYSDIHDGKFNNAKNINHFMIFTGVYTLATYFIIKRYPDAIYVFPMIFGVIMFVIGNMGYYLKPLNPTFELSLENHGKDSVEPELTDVQKKILHNLLEVFEKQKIYLNSQLNILQVVQIVGANRSYLSAVINRQFNENFCSFVNGYRIEELRRVYIGNPDYSNEILAELSGFGSVNSMKRSVFARTGMTVNEWKKDVIKSQMVG